DEDDDDDYAEQHQGESDTTPVSSPVQRSGKKRKVTWEDGILSPSPSSAYPSPSVKEKSLALVREEVRRAIIRHTEGGDSDAYDCVKELFTIDPKKWDENDTDAQKPPTTTTLANHLLGLLANVAALDGSCSTLVQAVLDSEWLGRDDDYVKLFVKFLGTLTAARGGFLNAALKKLASALKEVPRNVRHLPDHDPVSVRAIYSRVHFALSYILQVVPSATGALSPILALCFPQDIESVKSHVAYTLNLIKIIEYAPELRSDLLALIVERLIKIDVQIQIDMDEFEDETNDDETDFDADGERLLADTSTTLPTPESIAFSDDSEDDSDNESLLSEEDLDPEIARIQRSKEHYQKIDYMIDILFSYYASSFSSGSEEDNDDTHDLLLAHFKAIILPTYRSRYSQFLLFHFSQSNPVLVDRFATSCIEIIMDKTGAPILRQYAAAYLASFVARGAHVNSEVVRDVFQLLGGLMQSIRIDYEAANGGQIAGPDLRRYAPFYAIAQALMYIFCFRWRDLTTAAIDGHIPLDALELDDVVFPPEIRDFMHSAVFSKLNPLKICAPSIVNEFARLSHHLNFIYVHSIIERNKRIHLSRTSNAFRSLDSKFAQAEREEGGEAGLGMQMRGYFPFDPYRLKRSGRWVDGDYIEYKGIPGISESQSETDTEAEVTDAESETLEESDTEIVKGDKEKIGAVSTAGNDTESESEFQSDYESGEDDA
ncbi:hypothetical protein KEM54_000992, partial [Ascosphaera aggregata]